MSWFKNPKSEALSEAREMAFALRKNFIYSRDTLAAKDVEAIELLMAGLEKAIEDEDLPALEKLKKDILKLGGRVFPSSPWDGWRENVEVFVVAIVIALGVRSYFLQPFKIPTGSMQPTLNGVQIVVRQEPPPSWPVRIFEMVALGRTYGTVESYQGGIVTSIRGGSITPWFEYTDVDISGRSVRIWANLQSVQRDLSLKEGVTVPANSRLQFRIDTGDQVLVNKVVYNFRKPTRGEVFVFRTTGIEYIERQLRRSGVEGSQFYIKRCVGIPGDTLEIEPPYLKVNGSIIREPAAFERVYSLKDGYRGYGILPDQRYLRNSQDEYAIGKDNYWAMGDNSYHSSDSRFWGPVVRSNLVGTGLIVYWPFTSHWGLIR